MKASEKIHGIELAYGPVGNFDMVKELGAQWVRMGISFPWTDKMNGTLSERYLDMKAEIEKVHASGLQIMISTPGLGAYRFDEELQETRWMESYPDFIGEKGTEEYYENIRCTMEFICRDLGECAGQYWQCMNEIDNPIFASHYSDEIVTMTARASADGIVRANPDARCGINLSKYDDEAIRIADLVYAPGHSFYYVGDDQYFGSWQEGTVEDWNRVIDAIYDRYHMPVLANEWGYSSGGIYSDTHVDPKIVPFGLPEECFTQRWYHQVPGGHTEQVQADFIYRGWQIFAENPHCIGALLFCWRDAKKCYHCGGTSCPSEDFWGVVTTDLRKKPAYYAMQKAMKDFYGE